MDGRSTLLALLACNQTVCQSKFDRLNACITTAAQGLGSKRFNEFPDDAKYILDSCCGELVPTATTLNAAAQMLTQLLGRNVTAGDVAKLCMAASDCPAAALPRTIDCCVQASDMSAAGRVAGLNLKFLEQAASELHTQEHDVLRALAKAAAAVQDAEALREKVDVSKRIWLLRAAGWLPSSSDWLPVFPAQVTAATAQVAQVLAMDDSEFWAFRSTCEFFVRKAQAGGGFTPWVPARGPSYLVSNSKAKGGGVTVHGDAAFMKAAGIDEDGESSDYSEDEDSAAAEGPGNMSRRKRKKAAGPTVGTKPSSSSKAQKAAGQSAVQVMLGGKTPQEAFAQGLLRVDAPAVPLPQSWLSAASDSEKAAVPPQCKVVPTEPQHLLRALSSTAGAEAEEKVDKVLADPVNCAIAGRLAAWMHCLAGLAPAVATPVGDDTGSDQDASSEKQGDTATSASAAAPAAPSSSFAFSVSLPGASSTPSTTQKPADSGSNSHSEQSDSEDEDALDKYCLDGMAMPDSDDEAGDIRQGAYVILARALQLQLQALTTADEAEAVTNAAGGRCPPSQKQAVVSGCQRAAAAVAEEGAVLQQLLSRISASEPEVLEFLGEDEHELSFPGGGAEDDTSDSEADSASDHDGENAPGLTGAAVVGAAAAAGAGSSTSASRPSPKDAEAASSKPATTTNSSEFKKARVKFTASTSDADFEAPAPRAGKSPATSSKGGKKRRRW